MRDEKLANMSLLANVDASKERKSNLVLLVNVTLAKPFVLSKKYEPFGES